MELQAILNQVTSFSSGIAEQLTKMAMAMAAVGVLSMALIQTAKDILPLRRIFQTWKVREWLGNETGPYRLELELFRSNATQSKDSLRGDNFLKIAEKDLLKLSTAGDPMALYSLPIEQLCGQLNAAAQVVLDYPWEYPELLGCLSTHARIDDMRLLWRQPSPDNPKPTQEQVDARTRVAHQVQRSIDGLQIAASSQWQYGLQVSSFVISFLICYIGILSVNGNNNLATAVVFGLAGGFFAPVARDLLASLQQMRKS
ncbi:hypothetical protein EPN96_03625 [bacterium]|nr:MAG: hypothetical protein EPN96_03625 [bacterium]